MDFTINVYDVAYTLILMTFLTRTLERYISNIDLLFEIFSWTPRMRFILENIISLSGITGNCSERKRYLVSHSVTLITYCQHPRLVSGVCLQVCWWQYCTIRRVWKYQREVIRIPISKNRQHNGQKKKYKRTNNVLQNIHLKLKIE